MSQGIKRYSNLEYFSLQQAWIIYAKSVTMRLMNKIEIESDDFVIGVLLGLKFKFFVISINLIFPYLQR